MAEERLQKVLAAESANADIFLSPRENYEKAKKAATKIKVIAVESFTDTLKSLQNIK